MIGTNSEENETISIPVTLNFSANYGDVNQDGIIDVLDLVRLVGIILNNYIPTDIEYTLSDLNDDGIVCEHILSQAFFAKTNCVFV